MNNINNKLTELGKFLRIDRIKRDLTLQEFATALDITPAYISLIEYGKRNITDAMVDKIVSYLQLESSAKHDFIDIVCRANKFVKINLDGVSENHVHLALEFAKKFDSLTDKEIDSILYILQK